MEDSKLEQKRENTWDQEKDVNAPRTANKNPNQSNKKGDSKKGDNKQNQKGGDNKQNTKKSATKNEKPKN